MQVHRHIGHLPEFKNAVVTIGTFDGVHLGHCSIIDQMKAAARAAGGETVIITFHPHPRRIVGNTEQTVQLLSSLPEKIELLRDRGIDHLVVVPFTPDFAGQSPDAYVKDFLIRYFKPHTLIIGYDHRFGKGRSGDFTLLEKYAAAGDFQLMEIPARALEEASISSTRIRQALLKGDVQLAASLLGYPYFFEGIVVKGNQLGRTIGYPTANLQLTDNEKLIPGNGVYAVHVRRKHPISGELFYYGGMMNIGVRPTVDGLTRVIEVHIFDFTEDIYGECLQVTLVAWLRAEKKFEGLPALVAQLRSDEETAKAALSH